MARRSFPRFEKSGPRCKYHPEAKMKAIKQGVPWEHRQERRTVYFCRVPGCHFCAMGDVKVYMGEHSRTIGKMAGI
jgi:hypothetical protein